MKTIQRAALLLLCALLLASAVLASGTIDLSKKASLTIHAEHGKTAIVGMEFQAYRISTVAQDGTLTVTTAYTSYADELDIRGKDDVAWQELAEKLERFIILNNKLTPQAKAKSDKTGVAKFSDLPLGLYLIIAQGVEQGNYVYTTAPFFVLLPEETEKDTWSYSVAANAKTEQNKLTTDLSVLKIWKDSCHESQRPKSITISLLRDGKVYETITLPQNGRWKYTWENLDTNHKWTVTEQQPGGYATPVITQEGYAFTITNTCNKTDSPSNPSNPSNPGNPSTPTTPNLPQTGQLRWPVPVLACAGVLLILIGLLRWKGRSYEA